MNNYTHALRPLHTLAALLLGLMLWLSSAPGLAQSPIRNFDHTKTGFQLSGVHSSQRCESCHINGVFKGTPRECDKCHVSGNRWVTGHNIVKPAQHLPTTLPCDTCHNTVTFSGAKFNHMNVTPGTQCGSCHNGMTAAGKPAGHIVTSGNCGDCHRTTAWLPAAKPDHSGFTTATVCASCHNGMRATGKPGNHMPTTLNCIACHSPMGSAFTPNTWNHTQQPVTNQCASCHTGGYLSGMGRPGNHIPYQVLTGVAIANCDTCHKAGFSTWFPGTFHSNVSISNQCATCHLSGVYGLTSKPNTAIHATVTGNCEACHRTTSAWTAAKPDHSLFTAATNCTSCHNNVAATGKPSNHMPTTLNCIACHSPTGALFTPNSWNHTQMPVAGQCDTCHTGSYLSGMGKPSNHIPYQLVSASAGAKCDTCHKAGFATWFPGTFHANVTVTGQCSTCHGSGAYGLTTKPVNHIPVAQLLNGTSLECNACHLSTTTWTSEKMNHNSSMGSGAGWCKSCHDSSTSYLGTMLKMPLNHRGGATVKVDCSQSGCHRPLGSFGAAYTKWN